VGLPSLEAPARRARAARPRAALRVDSRELNSGGCALQCRPSKTDFLNSIAPSSLISGLVPIRQLPKLQYLFLNFRIQIANFGVPTFSFLTLLAISASLNF
jgi:hypothetical protein